MNTEKPSSKTSPSRPLTVFLAVQAILVGVAAAGAGYRYLQVEADSEMPALRTLPREVASENDEPQVITDRELASVLRKLRPRFDGVDTKIGIVDHNLRFWGVEATFDDPAFV
ncbi:MAG: hypothetical protein KDA41_04345, partial [Planctomycetales bacterium]|nr:hypothetical protein [Planctomycetales bacterium]